ncbi:hypothetical protein ACFFRR_006352 [Megaselia abdita]
MSVVQYLFGGIFLAFVLILWSRRKFYLLTLKIPGPLGLPLIGMAHKLRKREDILQVIGGIEKTYSKTFLSWLGPFPFLVVSEPNLVGRILNSTDFLNKSLIYNAVAEGTGDGLFSCDTPKWNIHRKAINPTFNQKVLVNFVPIFNEEVNLFVEEVTQNVSNHSKDLNLSISLQKLSLNNAARTTMGKQMSSLTQTESDLLHCFQFVLKIMTKKLFSPWYQFKFIFQRTNYFQKYEDSKMAMRSFIRKLIKDKHEKGLDTEILEDPDKIPSNKNIFIEHAINLANSGTFSWQDVEDEANVIVFGAFETTANTVGYILMCLAMHPQYQQRLFEEVSSVIGPQRDSYISYEQIQDMVYMDMVINETMRVMAPVPLIARTTKCDVKITDDITLPKGLQVAIDIFNMQRDEDIWGEHARCFYPDHFLKDNLADKHPYAFIPFSKGMRNCIGWRYALISIKITLAKILLNFKISTSFLFEELEFQEDITLKLKKYPKLDIEIRN